tara:strand:+ start:60 stop:410 length:351 start_codon:yes stop_codon:yes gene_type:complete
MRVRLSYTAEIDEVLSEAAFLLGTLADTFEESIKLYNKTVTHLKDKEFNPNKFHENMDVLRQNLGKIDTRCLEINQVITGFEDYQRQERQSSPDDPGAVETVSPSVEAHVSETTDD